MNILRICRRPDCAHLREKSRISVRPGEEPLVYPILVQWFPMLLLIGVVVLCVKCRWEGKAMSFGKSRAKLLTENQHKSDV
jgi:cell division protease FtsH